MAKPKRNKNDQPTPKTSNVDYDRNLDREQRDPRELPDEFVTDAEIEARELERRRREGGRHRG
jgi:hypothetical protein